MMNKELGWQAPAMGEGIAVYAAFGAGGTGPRNPDEATTHVGGIGADGKRFVTCLFSDGNRHTVWTDGER